MIKSALIGYTGFVGSNLAMQHNFTNLYNRQNIASIHNENFDLIVCAAAPGDMQYANSHPEQDLDSLDTIIKHLAKVKAKKCVLISTIAVYRQPVNGANEDALDAFETTIPYGKNRRQFEVRIQNLFPQTLIVRLPALFGHHLKKNLIYDLKNPIPSFIRKDKFLSLLNSLSSNDKEILEFNFDYVPQKEIYFFQKTTPHTIREYEKILAIFQNLDFTALHFTNPESEFQFYNLENLWKDIQHALSKDITELNICSEPIKAKVITKKLLGLVHPESSAQKYAYNMQTKWSQDFMAKPPYLYNQNVILADLKTFFQKDWS